MSETTARVLRRAADNLESRGWCQGTMFDGEGRMCALGALYITKADPYTLGEAQLSLIHHLGVNTVAPWNDAPGRTQQDVVKALRETADVEDFR